MMPDKKSWKKIHVLNGRLIHNKGNKNVYILLLLFIQECIYIAYIVWLFATTWLQHARPLCPSLSPEVCPSSCPLHWWYLPAISSSDTLFSLYPQSFPVSGTFPLSQLFSSDDQNTGASTSVLPVNIQGWFPWRLTGLIALLSKGFSGVFSSTTVWRHQFFGALPSLLSSSHNCVWPLGRP